VDTEVVVMGSQNEVASVCSSSTDNSDDVRSADGGYELMEPVGSGGANSQTVEFVSDVASRNQATCRSWIAPHIRQRRETPRFPRVRLGDQSR